jgi:hypothetical protein
MLMLSLDRVINTLSKLWPFALPQIANARIIGQANILGTFMNSITLALIAPN